MDYLQYIWWTYEWNNKTNSSFKPYYKWITFNTVSARIPLDAFYEVLNLIINGLPSIQKGREYLAKIQAEKF